MRLSNDQNQAYLKKKEQIRRRVMKDLKKTFGEKSEGKKVQ